MSNDPKYAYFAAIIQDKILELFDTESGGILDLNEISENNELTDLFHALSTVVPCNLYNKVVGGNKSHLHFNHMANQLCFQFSTFKKAEE